MDNKVQQLADKIYQEGVQKASAEADQIIQKAKEESERILSETRQQVEEMKARQERDMQAMESNTKAEVRLASQQAMEAVRSEILEMITEKVVTRAVDKAFSNPSALYEVVLKMAQQWANQEEITIATKDAKELQTYFEEEAQDLLHEGVTIKSVNGKAHTFTLSPKDGAYKVTIGKEAFAEYFKEFASPRLRAFLFGDTAEEK